MLAIQNSKSGRYKINYSNQRSRRLESLEIEFRGAPREDSQELVST
jgi:hypothetical protein